MTIIPVAVGLILDGEGNILVSKRIDPQTPAADGKWDFIGGKVEPGENPEETIVREAKEETGLEIKPLRLLPKILSNIWERKDLGTTQALLLAYECSVVGGKLHTQNFDHKIAELKFIPPRELDGYDTLASVKELLALLNEKT